MHHSMLVPPSPTSPIQILRLFLEARALQFGDFTLKSGKKSPYFFNVAQFDQGHLLRQLAFAMAALLERTVPHANIVFGPAYKGAALAVAVAMEWSALSGRKIGWLFNRKEAKTHGDAGVLVGRIPSKTDRLVMVDDVITDGGAKREALALLQSITSAPLLGVAIAFDRCEPMANGQMASQHFSSSIGVPLVSLLDAKGMLSNLQALGFEEYAAYGITNDAPQTLQAHLQNLG